MIAPTGITRLRELVTEGHVSGYASVLLDDLRELLAERDFLAGKLLAAESENARLRERTEAAEAANENLLAQVIDREERLNLALHERDDAVKRAATLEIDRQRIREERDRLREVRTLARQLAEALFAAPIPENIILNKLHVACRAAGLLDDEKEGAG